MKDSIDKIKRAKAQNAAGPNAQSLIGWPEHNIEAISEIKIVTHEDPTHISSYNLSYPKEEKDPKKIIELWSKVTKTEKNIGLALKDIVLIHKECCKEITTAALSLESVDFEKR